MTVLLQFSCRVYIRILKIGRYLAKYGQWCGVVFMTHGVHGDLWPHTCRLG